MLKPNVWFRYVRNTSFPISTTGFTGALAEGFAVVFAAGFVDDLADVLAADFAAGLDADLDEDFAVDLDAGFVAGFAYQQCPIAQRSIQRTMVIEDFHEAWEVK